MPTKQPETYQERRAKHLRGQGEPFNPVVAHHLSPDWPTKPVSKKALKHKTKRARKAEQPEINNASSGTKGGTSAIYTGKTKRPEQLTYPPGQTNHMRHQSRQLYRKQIKLMKEEARAKE